MMDFLLIFYDFFSADSSRPAEFIWSFSRYLYPFLSYGQNTLKD